MAIYHFTTKTVGRRNNGSTVAKAAYIARDRIPDKRTGAIKDYRKKGGLVFSGILLPKDAPEWAKDRANLWNGVETAEKRKDALLAHEYEIALPYELSDEHRLYLIKDFVREQFTRKGYAVDLNIHAPDTDGDQRNHHAHILVTDRRLLETGFAPDKKERQKNTEERKEELIALRLAWEKLGNRHLQRRGFQPTLDHRSFEARGIDRTPSVHLGPVAVAMERKGLATRRHNAAAKQTQPDAPQPQPTQPHGAHHRPR